MLLAELEVRHSRPIAPTRRVAIGRLYLPIEPAPGFGGLLLAGLVGAFASELDDEFRDRLDVLLDDIEWARPVTQPRMRYRLQADTHGLDHSRHRLVRRGEGVELEIDDHANGLPQILGAVYAAGKLSVAARPGVFRLLRRATRWQGEADQRLLGFLRGDSTRALGPGNEGWALTVLGFGGGREPTRGEISRRFRELVRDAHPDHGGPADLAPGRILDLTEAKRILLTVG